MELTVGDFVTTTDDPLWIYRISKTDGATFTCVPVGKNKWTFNRVQPPGALHECGAARLIHYAGDLPRLWRIRNSVAFLGLIVAVASCVLAFNAPDKMPRALIITAVWAFGPPG